MNYKQKRPCTQRKMRREPLPPTVGVVVRAGSRSISLRACNLNQNAVGELRSACTQATQVTFKIFGLAEWPDAARWPFFELVKELGCVSVEVNSKQFSDPFEAVVEAMVGAAHLASFKNTFNAAVEAAALFHPEIPEVPAAKIAKRILETGGTNVREREIVRRIRLISEPQTKSGSLTIGPDPRAAAASYLASLVTPDEHVVGDEFAEDATATDAPAEEKPKLLFFRESFSAYTDHRWCRLDDSLIIAKVTRFLQQDPEHPPTQSFINSVMINLRALALVPNWDHHPPFYLANRQAGTITGDRFIAFANGMISVAEAMSTDCPVLRPHDSRWFSEIVLPFDYDPDAQCPGWLAFLNQNLPRSHDDDRRQEILEEFMGYCLQPDTTMEKMLIIYGNGGGGKSVALNIISALLGEKNVSSIGFEQLSGEFRLVNLVSKAANITREMSHIGKLNEGILKQLISGEPIDANQKHKSPRKITSTAKLVVGTNDLPSLSDTSDGIWRRLILMPFDVQIPACQRNPNLTAELANELPGIFNRALAGLRRLMTQGRFSDCVVCNAALASHRSDSDSAGDFVEALCTRTPTREVHIQRLYELYEFYSTARRRKPVAENEFGKRMKRLGFERVRATAADLDAVPRPWLYRGLKLSPEGRAWETRLVQKLQPGWLRVDYVAP